MNIQKKIYIKRWGVFRSLYTYLLLKLDKHFELRVFVVETRNLNNSNKISFTSNGLLFRSITQAELLASTKNSELDIEPAFIKENMNQRNECLGALKNDILIGYTWRSLTQTQVYKNIWIKFPDNTIYNFKSLVLPSYRGQHVLNKIYSLGEKDLINQGKSVCLSFTESHNYSSLKAKKRAGYKIIGYIAHIKLLKHYFIWHSPGSRKFGVSFFLKYPQ